MSGSARPKVVVLGSSFAGLTTARFIRARCGDAVDLTVVDRNPYLIFVPNIPMEVFADHDPLVSMHMETVRFHDRDGNEFINAAKAWGTQSGSTILISASMLSPLASSTPSASDADDVLRGSLVAEPHRGREIQELGDDRLASVLGDGLARGEQRDLVGVAHLALLQPMCHVAHQLLWTGLLAHQRVADNRHTPSIPRFPWVGAMGHSPYAWSVLGAAAQVTSRIELMTYVTCPIKRYHPAVVAQKAATVGILSDGRFTLGLGAGENLNEHVTGGGWPPVNVRHQMLDEAVDIIRGLWAGDYLNYDGRYFQVDSAKIWDLPEQPLELGIAASGEQSGRLAGEKADLLVAVEPDASIVDAFEAAGGGGKPRVGQLPVCYDIDRNAAIKRALDLFGWFGGGWKVNAELPSTAAFDAASTRVRAEDIAEAIPCGDSVEAVVEAVEKFAGAGFTHVALCQIGGDHQSEFVEWFERSLFPALNE